MAIPIAVLIRKTIEPKQSEDNTLKNNLPTLKLCNITTPKAFLTIY